MIAAVKVGGSPFLEPLPGVLSLFPEPFLEPFPITQNPFLDPFLWPLPGARLGSSQQFSPTGNSPLPQLRTCSSVQWWLQLL